jgi:hypothetical protein
MTAVQDCMTRISVIKSIIRYSSEKPVTQSRKKKTRKVDI